MVQTPNPQIRDIGIPVRSVNWVQLHPGHDQSGAPCLYATMGQQADNLFVLQIEVETGTCRQFVSEVPKSNYPTATLMSRTGQLYVGAAYAGHLLRFDPETDTLTDLGAINPGGATFPCRIDEDPDGQIWIGSYGAADLTCYNPETEQFTRYGRMDEVDMYNYPLFNFIDGTVACLIRVTESHIVVLNPQTGEKQTVGPVVPKDKGTIDLRRGNDDHLYIVSSEGNFRIEGTEAVPVEAIPNAPPSPTLSNGSTFNFTDGDALIYRQLEVRKPDGETRTFNLDYQAGGSDIFYLHAGPDRCIYGSSILPLHLFRYDPESGELSDLGQCSTAAGEAYSMASFEGKIYISSYPGATLSEYDPAQPYHFGSQPDDNPRDLGRIDDISYRPRSTLAGPLGRIWTASIPDYGRWGGPLSCYDPKTGEKKAYYQICGDASCYTLAHLPEQELIAVGTTIAGGSGTQPKVDEAVLFLWDYNNEEKVWESGLEPPVTAFNALLTGPDGRLYGTVQGGELPAALFVFNSESREFTHRLSLPDPNPRDLGLQNGPDGNIYGFTSTSIYRLHPDSLAIEVVCEGSGFGIAGPILGEELYFATGHHLRSVKIF